MYRDRELPVDLALEGALTLTVQHLVCVAGPTVRKSLPARRKQPVEGVRPRHTPPPLGDWQPSATGPTSAGTPRSTQRPRCGALAVGPQGRSWRTQRTGPGPWLGLGRQPRNGKWDTSPRSGTARDLGAVAIHLRASGRGVEPGLLGQSAFLGVPHPDVKCRRAALHHPGPLRPAMRADPCLAGADLDAITGEVGRKRRPVPGWVPLRSDMVPN